MTSLSLNVGNFVTLKLTSSNYPLWREQVLGLAESQDLIHHLDTATPIPPQYSSPNSTTTSTETTTSTPTIEFVTWQKSDRLLRGWIIGTLSEEALGLVIGLGTASAVWDALKEAYAQDSQEREFTLRQQLTYLRKDDNKSITAHTMLKPPRPTYSELISPQRPSWLTFFPNCASSPGSVCGRVLANLILLEKRKTWMLMPWHVTFYATASSKLTELRKRKDYAYQIIQIRDMIGDAYQIIQIRDMIGDEDF